MGVLSCKERLLLSLRTRVDPSTHVRGSTTVTSVAEDLILSSSFCGHPHTCGIQKFDTHTIKQSIVSQKYVCPLLFMSLWQNRKQLKERRVCFHTQWPSGQPESEVLLTSTVRQQRKTDTDSQGCLPSSHFIQPKVTVLKMVLATFRVSPISWSRPLRKLPRCA